MEQFFYLIVGFACPIGMGLMMWFMMRGMGSKQDQQPAQPSRPWQRAAGDEDLGELTPEDKLAVLQARQRRLDAEIRALRESEVEPSRN